MDINIIAAWIGCLTGIYSFLYHLVSMYKNRLNVIIEFPFTMNIYFNKPPQNPTDTNLQGLFYIRVSNPSNKPITIHSIHVFYGSEQLIVDSYDYPEKILKLPFDDKLNKYYESLDMTNQLEAPFRLEPHDTKQGLVFLRFFPDNNNDYIELKVSLNVLNKHFDQYVVLKRYINQNSLLPK